MAQVNLTLKVNAAEAVERFRKYLTERAGREFRGIILTKLDMIELIDRAMKDFDFGQFIAVEPTQPNEPVDYATKCKRMRRNAPTPCLHCGGECVG